MTTTEIPLIQNRKSSAKEDIARNLLAKCLAKCPIAMKRFLELFFSGKVPIEFRKRSNLRMETDVCCNGSFADLVIYARKSVFCLEVKINAVEQVGQYSKYQEFFEAQNLKTYIAGLLKVRSNNKNPFLESVTRVCWVDLLEKFGKASDEIKSFESDLQKIDSQLLASQSSVNAKIGSEKARQIAQDPRRLSTDNVLLSHCFKDLISKMPKSFKGKLWQAGNAPLSVFTWQLDWQQNFVDGWFPKISLSLNKNTRAHSHDEPNFGFAVFLWHTDWCHNREWFLHNRRIILDHFSKRSFRIVRNTKGTWHTQFDWHSPYLEAEGLKYVNSFPPFKLYESDYGKYDWERIISILHGELCTIGENVNQLRSKLPLR